MRYVTFSVCFIIAYISIYNLYAGEWRLSDSVEHSMRFRAIYCYDSLNCVTVGNEYDYFPIARLTSDGGKTWHQIFRDTAIFDNEKNDYIWQCRRVLDVAYPDSNLIFLLHDYGVYFYSTDKGKTWEKPGNLNGFEMLQNWTNFYNSEIGGFTNNLSAYYTYNGCKTFKEITFPNKYIFFEDIAFPDENNIYALCYNHDNWGNTTRIIKSSNRGMDWDTLPIPPLRIRRIYFFDTLNGFGYGMRRIASLRDNSVILKTSDGGYTWRIVLDSLIGSKQNGLINMSFAPDRLNGIAIGYTNQVLRTKDGGETWFYDSTYFDIAYDWPSDAHQISSNSFFITSSDNRTVWEYYENGFTSVPHFQIAEHILLFPNPTTGEVNIKLNNHTLKGVVKSVKIYDVLGNVVVSLGDSRFRGNDSQDIRLDVSSLAAGVYFVRVGGQVLKFVKM